MPACQVVLAFAAPPHHATQRSWSGVRRVGRTCGPDQNSPRVSWACSGVVRGFFAGGVRLPPVCR